MDHAETDVLRVEQAGAVRLLVLNRPRKLNAFSDALLAALEQGVEAALAHDGTHVLVITGAGERAFSAGNDIARLAGMDAMAAHADMLRGQRLLRRLHESPKPVIAMVNGLALGGGFELVLACDFILAARTAAFGFPEITLDTLPGWGGTQLAVQWLGLARAREMVLCGQVHDTAQCQAWGLLTRVCEPAALREETLAFAATLAARHPYALHMAKRAVQRAAELPLAAGMDFEAASYAANFGTPHARAGLRQFAARKSTSGGQA
ncbi:Enoyl-CoA hydratase [plant metagenome]|uniref:Enoyl-CoA hydratase n=1 Tax=plant metagenome TaxID=1297885 RepID=A0A484QCK2_9ZZZZ